MRSLFTIAKFELLEAAKTVSTYVYFLIFIALGVTFAAISGFFSSHKAVIEYLNSPLNISLYLSLLLMLLLLFIMPLFFAELSCKDFESNFGGLLFTCPVRKWEYLGGRLLAGVIVAFFVFLGAGIGFEAGTWMPWIKAEYRAPFSALAYLLPYLYDVLPDLVIFGAIYLVMGVLTRQSSFVTRGGLFVVVILFVWGSLLSSLTKAIPALGFLETVFNIFGGAIAPEAASWSIAEKNTKLLQPGIGFLLNRLLWLGLAIGLLAWASRRLQFAPDAKLLNIPLPFLKPRPTPSIPPAPLIIPGIAPPIPSAHPSFTLKDQLSRALYITLAEFQFLIRNRLTWILVVFLIVSLFISVFQFRDSLYHAPLIPTTGRMLSTLNSFAVFLIAVLMIYLAGDLLWRDRSTRMNVLTDALPIPSWAVLLGKFIGLALMLTVPLLLSAIACMAVQTVQGYFHYDVGIYLYGLCTITLPKLLLIAALTVFIQVLVNHKGMGYALSALIIFGSSILKIPLEELLPLPWSLVLYAEHPAWQYSDINGYGNTLEPTYWYLFYWGCLAILLLAIAVLLWQRGVETSLRARLKLAQSRLSRPTFAVLLTALIAFLLTGSWVFYNVIGIRNLTANDSPIEAIHQAKIVLDESTPQQVAYEKTNKLLEYAQPRITDIDLKWDYFAQERRLHSRGRYQLQNKTKQPINRILVTAPINTKLTQLALGNQTTPTKTEFVSRSIVRSFKLITPLDAGATTDLTFDFERQLKGFSDPADTSYNANGAFLSEANQQFMPNIGYLRNLELDDADVRRQNRLPVRSQVLSPNDPNARRQNAFAPDADRVNFSATVSTSRDQIAVMPGDLQREWTESDRHYFTYKSPKLINNFYAMLSGRYERLIDRWKDVQVEIFYHPDHAANVKQMMTALKRGLDYYTTNWSPYPFKQLRLLEFPYGSFGQAYPGTIVLGEEAGFLFKTDPQDVSILNPAFEITAHELAHQWWAHQFTPANALGSGPETEIMAQYGAFMVLEREYGKQEMQYYLDKEQTSYHIAPDEVPLIESTALNVVYPKGASAMYALKDYIGEDVLNRALARLLQQYANVPPYPTIKDLVGALRTATPPDLQYLITDLFETVTAYSFDTKQAVWTRRQDGYEVELTINVDKLRQNKSTNASPSAQNVAALIPGFTSVPMNDPIEIGVKDGQGNFLYLQKHRLKNGTNQIAVVVEQQPTEAGVDPIQKLINLQGTRVIPVIEKGKYGNPNPQS